MITHLISGRIIVGIIIGIIVWVISRSVAGIIRWSIGLQGNVVYKMANQNLYISIRYWLPGPGQGLQDHNLDHRPEHRRGRRQVHRAAEKDGIILNDLVLQ